MKTDDPRSNLELVSLHVRFQQMLTGGPLHRSLLKQCRTIAGKWRYRYRPRHPQYVALFYHVWPIVGNNGHNDLGNSTRNKPLSGQH